MPDSKPIAWRVEFEDGSVELWPAEDIQGEPAFGRWVTPLVAGGSTVDNDPEAEISWIEEKDAMDITPEKLTAAGFAETFYEHDRESGAFYVKRLPAGQVPYARDSLIDGDFIMDDDEVVIEVTPDQSVQMVVPAADFVVEPVPVGSDEGRDMLRGIGLDV